MTVLIAITSLCAVLLVALCITLWLSKARNSNEEPMQTIAADFQSQIGNLRKEFQEQSFQLNQLISDQQQHNTKFLQDTHKDYRSAIGQVNTRLGELGQATQSMMDVGKDIASLQDILRAPKLRGSFGELFLADLLSQILPRENYELQYTFKNKVIVDAVIKLAEGMIPVDAKFPLENFKRILEGETEEAQKAPRKTFFQDVKKHIDVISSKYILPAENTFDFAIMYIPAENVYYEIIIKSEFQAESLANYALKKKVIPVSPNSFYAYLQSIVRGLKGMKIERSAEMILKSLGQIESDLNRIAEDFDKIGGHLSNAQSAYERTGKSFDKMKNKLAVLDSQNQQKEIEASL